MEKMMKKVAIATTIASAVGVSAVVDNTAKADSVTPTQAKTQTKTDQVQANADTAKQNLRKRSKLKRGWEKSPKTQKPLEITLLKTLIPSGFYYFLKFI